MSSNVAVMIQDLSVHHGTLTILDKVCLSIPEGERVAVVGHNGAGKSTLLKSMSGNVATDQGTVKILDVDISEKLDAKELVALRSKIGIVHQGMLLVPRLTAIENVLIGRLSRNRSPLIWARLFPKEDVAMAREALRTVGMLHKEKDRVDHLSGGERQKIAIARVLAQEAKIILADEPTASLDPQAAKETATLLSDVARERNLTMIAVVHATELLSTLASRVIGLKKGRVTFDQQTQNVSQELLRELYT